MRKYWIAAMAAGITLTMSANASAQDVQKHTAPAGRDGKPARILQSAEVPPGATTLYLSGQIASPINPAAPAASLADMGNTERQSRDIYAKIEKILAARGYAMRDVIKVTIYLSADPALGKMDFAGANAAFDAYFNVPGNPTTVARTTLEVSGFAGPYYLVEIDIVAAKVK